MLEDRDYMRQSSSRFQWSACTVLVAINLVIFVLQHTVVSQRFQDNYLNLSLAGLKHGYVWQFLSFQFLHGGIWHVAFNCLSLYMFGRAVESVFGAAKFVTLYLLSGVFGGLLHVFAAFAWPMYFDSPVVGASAGVFGIIAAFAMLFPDEQLLLFFVIRIRARTLLWLELILTALGISAPHSIFGGNVAHAAHLGGILMGLAFFRFHEEFGSISFNWFRRKRRPERVHATVVKMPKWPLSKVTLSADPPEEEFISKEVDPILDKISAHGIQSLTQRERDILERARNKMGKR